MAKTGKLHLVGTKFSKMTTSNFGSNSLCGPSTVFQGTWPNQGGGPQDPPRNYNLWPRRPKMAKTGIMHFLGSKFSKMTAPNFVSNSLFSPSAVFRGTWPNQGAGPQDPPKKLQFVAQATQKGQNWHNAPFGLQIFQNDSPKCWARFFMWP